MIRRCSSTDNFSHQCPSKLRRASTAGAAFEHLFDAETIAVSARTRRSCSSRRTFSAQDSRRSFINRFKASFTHPFSWHRVVKRRPQCVYSVSIAAMSCQVFARSASEIFDELALAELVAEVIVERESVTSDPVADDEPGASEWLDFVSDCPVPPLPVSNKSPNAVSASHGRMRSHNLSIASWQRRHSNPASLTSSSQQRYCRSRRRIASHVSLTPLFRPSRRNWVSRRGL